MPIFRRKYLIDKSRFPANSRKKWHCTLMCLLFDELNGCLVKAIAPLLPSNTPILGDARLVIIKTDATYIHIFLRPVGHSYVLRLCSE